MVDVRYRYNDPLMLWGRVSEVQWNVRMRNILSADVFFLFFVKNR